MSDPLTRLAARQLGQTPVLQPRIAPLFASERSLTRSPEAPGESEVEFALLTGNRESERQMDSSELMVARRVAPKAPPQALELEPRASQASRSNISADRQAPAQDSFLSVSWPTRGEQVAVGHPTPAPVAAHEDKLGLDTPRRAVHRRTPEIAVNERRTRIQRALDPQIPDAPVSLASHARSPLLATRTQPTDFMLDDAPPTRLLIAEQRLTAAVAEHLPQRLSPKAEATPNESPVYVRIGRIEVTALSSSPKTQPAPRVAPENRTAPMPLSEYLAQRRGRGE